MYFIVNEKQEVPFWIWTDGTVDAWLNGVHNIKFSLCHGTEFVNLNGQILRAEAATFTFPIQQATRVQLRSMICKE